MLIDLNIHGILIAVVFPLLRYSVPGTVKISTVHCSIIINTFSDSLKGLPGFLAGLLPHRAARDKGHMLERRKTLNFSLLKYDSPYYLLTTSAHI